MPPHAVTDNDVVFAEISGFFFKNSYHLLEIRMVRIRQTRYANFIAQLYKLLQDPLVKIQFRASFKSVYQKHLARLPFYRKIDLRPLAFPYPIPLRLLDRFRPVKQGLWPAL